MKRGLSEEAIRRIAAASDKEAKAPDYDPEMDTQLFGDYEPLSTDKAFSQPVPSTDLNQNDRLTQLWQEVLAEMPEDPEGALSIAIDLLKSENAM